MAECYFLGNNTPYQMMGFVIKTKGHTLVIDGGLWEDAPALCHLLEEIGTKQVDGWFFTHPHHDHLGAFMRFSKEYRHIPVKKLYLHFPDRLTLRAAKAHKAHGGIERRMWEEIWDLLEAEYASSYEKINRGDRFFFDEICVNVLRVMDPEQDRERNFINNTSAVFRVDSPRKKLLILGDVGIQSEEKLISEIPAEEWDADFTQMAHHGQKGPSRAFYEYIKPRFCLWPTPSFIWENDGGEGPGTGKWDTLLTRSWMEELGVTQHLVAKDGTVRFLLD